jgi:pimeloyl-ACP methyl ester carboxylesterase
VEDVKASQGTTSIADTEFVLCGHSIGAWVCTEVMLRRPDLNIVHTFCLFPFIQVDLTWKEFAQFHTMFFLRPVLSVAAYALSFCPRPIMKKLFSVFAKDVTSSEANVDATLKIVNFTGSRNALFMGETEFKTVPDKIDVTAFRTIAPKLTMYYADAQHHDHWAPSNQRKELAALLEGAGTTFQEFPYNHAFVLYADQVTGIAAAVKNRLPQIQ